MGRPRGTWDTFHDSAESRSRPLTAAPLASVLSFISSWSQTLRGHSSDARQQKPSPEKLSQSNASSSTSLPQDAETQLRTLEAPIRSIQRTTMSRPASMVFTYQPHIVDIAHDTLPELQPIFSYLNAHANKVYQEGYFLKLNDLDARMARLS